MHSRASRVCRPLTICHFIKSPRCQLRAQNELSPCRTRGKHCARREVWDTEVEETPQPREPIGERERERERGGGGGGRPGEVERTSRQRPGTGTRPERSWLCSSRIKPIGGCLLPSVPDTGFVLVWFQALSPSLSPQPLSLSLSPSLSLSLSPDTLSLSNPSLSLSLSPSLCLSVCLSVCLCLSLSVCLSVCLSLSQASLSLSVISAALFAGCMLIICN